MLQPHLFVFNDIGGRGYGPLDSFEVLQSLACVVLKAINNSICYPCPVLKLKPFYESSYISVNILKYVL
jgi:hypothetical protein